MPTETTSLLGRVETNRKPPLPVKMLIELIATLYGNITGLLIWRCLTIIIPSFPTKTATDLLLIFVSSFASSSGIINLCRHHLYAGATRIQTAEENTAMAIWHELAGPADMETSVRIFASALKLVGGIAEGAISYATAEEVFENASEDFRFYFSLTCAIVAFLGFPTVEGSSITSILKGEIPAHIKTEGAHTFNTKSTSPPKRIFYPDSRIIAEAHNKTFRINPPPYSASNTKLLMINALTILGVLGWAILAFSDSEKILSRFTKSKQTAIAPALLIAILYAVADTALRGIKTKLRLLNLTEHSTKHLAKHNPATFLFAALQSALMALIPLVAVFDLYVFFKNDSTGIEIKEMPLTLLLLGAALGALRFPISLFSEGEGLIQALHDTDGNPLFNSSMNALQFASVTAASAYQLSRNRYTPEDIAITFLIAGGASATNHFLRHGLANTCVNPEKPRVWRHRSAPWLSLLGSALVPALTGAAAEALCLYVILPHETDDPNKTHETAAIVGGVTAGVTAVLWRILTNDYFTKKMTRLREPEFQHMGGNCFSKACHTVSVFFGSWRTGKTRDAEVTRPRTPDSERARSANLSDAGEPPPRTPGRDTYRSPFGKYAT